MGCLLDDGPVAVPIHNHQVVVALVVKVVGHCALEGVSRIHRRSGGSAGLGRRHPVALLAAGSHFRDGWGHTGPEKGRLGPGAHL